MPAILVDAGDDTMITVVKADIGGVDMRSRGQDAIEQIAACLGAEIAGIDGRHLGDKPQRALGALD